MTHDLAWFQARKNKEVIREYEGNETKVTIQGERGEAYVEYFHSLQDEGFTFTDTAANMAAQEYDFDLPEGDGKKAAKPRVHISEEICISCSS